MPGFSDKFKLYMGLLMTWFTKKNSRFCLQYCLREVDLANDLANRIKMAEMIFQLLETRKIQWFTFKNKINTESLKKAQHNKM
jgi:hypothetical protein